MRTLAFYLVAALFTFPPVGGSGSAYGAAPGAVEVSCDVDRRAFRLAAKDETQVAFRLWDSETGGSQCGTDYLLPMSELTVFNAKTDRFDGEKSRRFASSRALLGSDVSPVDLCSGTETWLEVAVASQTMTCDFSSKAPRARRRIPSVLFAQVPAQGVPGSQGPPGPQGPPGGGGSVTSRPRAEGWVLMKTGHALTVRAGLHPLKSTEGMGAR